MYTYGITGTSVDEFRDVTLTAVSDGQVLKWDSATSQWVNVDPSTLSIALDNLSDVTLSAPEEFQILEYNGTAWVNKHASVSAYVRNVDTVTLATGTAVYLFGATGDHATVKRADNDSDTTSSKVIGLVAAPIAQNENGTVITRGYVDGIDLSVGYAPGDILYLGEDGGFTKVKPVAPEHTVFLGVVVRATNNGIVYVATQNGYELEELHDVKITAGTLDTGDVLAYNGTTGVWENTEVSSLGITLGTDTTGNYVSDVTAGTGISVSHTPAEGSSPTVSLSASLDNLSDVVVTSAAIGQVLEHNGTNFVNRADRPAPLGLQVPVNTRKYTQVGSFTTGVPGINVGSAAVVTFKNACSITALSIYLTATYSAATTYDYRLGIYADSNGAPGALLVDAGTVSIATGATAGFKTITLGSAQSVAANTPVWLVCAATHAGTVPNLSHYAGHLQPYADYGLSSATHTQAVCLAYFGTPATVLPATFSLASPETQPAGVAVFATVSVP